METAAQREKNGPVKVSTLAPERPPLVLVAEDDPELRSLISDVLRRNGFAVKAARDGSNALDRLGSMVLGTGRGPAPDLVITDYRMPKFDGLDVIEALRLAYIRTPIIMITAFGDPAVLARARTLGVVAVLDKPFDLRELVTLARRAAKAGRAEP